MGHSVPLTPQEFASKESASVLAVMEKLVRTRSLISAESVGATIEAATRCRDCSQSLCE